MVGRNAADSATDVTVVAREPNLLESLIRRRGVPQSRLKLRTLFINGQRVSSAGAVTSPVYDPSTGLAQASLEQGDAEILAQAEPAQLRWGGLISMVVGLALLWMVRNG